MGKRVDWPAHADEFARQQVEGITLGEYCSQNGLNITTARRHLKPRAAKASKSPLEAPAITPTAEDDQIAALLAPVATDSLGEAEAVMMRDALHRYVASQEANIAYLQRACDSFDGLIPLDDDRYIEPARDKDDRPVSPHKDLATANLQLLGVINNAGKALGSVIGAITRSRTSRAAALRQQRDALNREALDHQRKQATSEALAGFHAKEDPWSAKRAAIHIEMVGGTVPHVIRAQLAQDMGFDADDQGEPISEEELDEICVKAELIQLERAKILKTRAAELAAIQDEERALNADPDEDVYLAPDPEEIDNASFDDACAVVGEPNVGGDDGE